MLAICSIPLPLVQAHAGNSSVGKFKGVVVDHEDKRIKAADVVVSSKNMSRQMRSNVDGEFEIELPTGIYEISVTKTGLKKHILTNLQIKAGATETFTFRLEPKITDGSDEVNDSELMSNHRCLTY